MNQHPDKLFREKLSGLQQAAPSQAWNRIESNLQRSHKVLWFRIAASLLVMIVVGFGAWRVFAPDVTSSSLALTQGTRPQTDEPSSPSPTKSVPSTHDALEESSAVDTKKGTASLPSVETSEESLTPLTTSRTSRNVKTSPKKKVSEEVLPLEELRTRDRLASAEDMNNGVATREENTKEEYTPASALVVAPPQAPERLHLILSADEVNDKYLNKKALAEATSPEKKSSTLRKLLDKAQDLKNNQDPMATLRQKKNEILALSFKNGKQKNSNK